MTCTEMIQSKKFQSTLPRRERPGAIMSTSLLNRFQSTLPRRERPITFSAFLDGEYFNPRSREGSDIWISLGYLRWHYYFNPRSREGSDHNGNRHGRELAYFNPRSREGSDNSTSLFVSLSEHFNPRSREGSDEKEKK